MFEKNRKTTLIASVVVAVFIFCSSFILNNRHVLISAIQAVLGTAVFLATTTAFSRYRASLAERAAAPENEAADVVWDVYMNDVRVASIPDNKLAAFQSDVANDWHIMVAQIFNLFRVPLRLFEQFVVVIPAIAFWLILAWALCDLHSLVQTFNAIRDASPNEIHQGVATAVTMLFTLSFIAFGLNLCLTGYAYGMRDVYRERMEYVLRRYLKIPATGELRILRVNGEVTCMYEPNMLGWLRARSRARRARAVH